MGMSTPGGMASWMQLEDSRAADESEIEFHADRVEFRRRDGDVETRCAVCVVPDADAEVRVVTLVNHGLRRREVDLLWRGYGRPVLSCPVY
jgi:Glycosyltransferase family 36